MGQLGNSSETSQNSSKQNGAAACTGATFCTSQGILFGAFWVHLSVHPYRTYFWTLLDALGRFGIDLGPPLGAIWSPLGSLWELLGSSSAPLGSLWELQCSSKQLQDLLEQL